MLSIVYFLYKKLFPIKYAKKIGVKVGKNCRLINVSFSTEPYLVELGNHVSATCTRFETHDGGVWVIRDKQPDIDVVKPIKIGNNVFLGYGSVVLPGVTIGDNVVIGAYSVVSRDIPDNMVAAGIPAKIIKPLEDYQKKVIATGDNTKKLTPQEKKNYYLQKYLNDGKS